MACRLADLRCEAGQLAPTDRRQQIAHPVIVSDLGMLIVRGRVAGLGGQESGPSDVLRVVGDEHPAARWS